MNALGQFLDEAIAYYNDDGTIALIVFDGNFAYSYLYWLEHAEHVILETPIEDLHNHCDSLDME